MEDHVVADAAAFAKVNDHLIAMANRERWAKDK
jgi:hypothetical protein